MGPLADMEQSPSAVVMVRPHHFISNPETAADNAFQQLSSKLPANKVAKQALMEVTYAANTLWDHGVTVHLFDDTSIETPDSVFPNNWFSTHEDGTLVIYPMYCMNRRKERRDLIIEGIKESYQVNRVIKYTHYEKQGLFLEGTGSLVLDHRARIAYAAESHRTHVTLLEKFCQDLDYQAMVFKAVDSQGLPIYHTNVFMNIATDFALIGSDLIADMDQRKTVTDRLIASGKEIIHMSNEQVYQFAANAFELSSPQGKLLAMSNSAYQVLTHQQIKRIEKYAQLVVLQVPTIEMAGGSVRCMLAGIHLPKVN